MPQTNDIGQVLRRLAVADSEMGAVPCAPGGAAVQRYLVGVLLAALPCLAFAVRYFGLRVLAMVLIAFVAGAMVEAAFGWVRHKPIGGGSLVFSVLLVLMLPPQIPLWMVALGSAFGHLFGKEVFGGTGSHLFSPVLIAKGFLMFSYPRVVTGSYFGSMLEFDAPYGWLWCSVAIFVGGIALVQTRRVNVRVPAGIILGAACLGMGYQMGGVLPFESVGELLVSDGFLFGAFFLAGDPSTCPRTDDGRWFYGFVIGAMAVLMRTYSNYSEAMLSAILVGNVFAPTVDALSAVRLGRHPE